MNPLNTRHTHWYSKMKVKKKIEGTKVLSANKIRKQNNFYLMENQRQFVWKRKRKAVSPGAAHIIPGRASVGQQMQRDGGISERAGRYLIEPVFRGRINDTGSKKGAQLLPTLVQLSFICLISFDGGPSSTEGETLCSRLNIPCLAHHSPSSWYWQRQ